MAGLPYPVVLASASPRRQELLRRLVPEFVVDPADLDEEALTDPDPWVTAQRLAREKAFAVFERHPGSLVIGGDTVVALPAGAGAWVQLAKPADAADAVRMLLELQGKTHTVVTGVALRWPGGMHAFTDATKVTFRRVDRVEIEAYVAGGEPLDKAGAYGFQGGARVFVERLEGSVETVIGLPVDRLGEALRSVGRG